MGAHAEIVKVRVARKGLEKSRSSFLLPALRGPTALVTATDPLPFSSKLPSDKYGVNALKMLLKPVDDDSLVFIAASVDGVFVDRDEFKGLKESATPIESMAGALASLPVYAVPSTVQSPTTYLVRTLESLAQKMEENQNAESDTKA